MAGRISSATWHRTLESNGFQTKDNGRAVDDPFYALAERASHFAASGGQVGSVQLTLSNASEDYSRRRVSITITVPCVCSEADISLAGEAAFIKAQQMVSEASAALGIPAP